MIEKAFFYAMAITLVLCLASVGIEHFSGSESFYLFMLGSPLAFWSLIFSGSPGGMDVPPSLMQMLALSPFIIVYYALFWLPIPIARNSAAAAMVWGAFFLGMHFILYSCAGSHDF